VFTPFDNREITGFQHLVAPHHREDGQSIDCTVIHKSIASIDQDFRRRGGMSNALPIYRNNPSNTGTLTSAEAATMP